MKGKNVVLGGLLAGLVFYAISVLTWWLFKFLPVVPLSIAIPSEGLQQAWMLEHLAVSLFIGLMWGLGYAVYGRGVASGWVYGATLFMAGSLPAFVTHFVISEPLRAMVFYGAVISFIAALLGGRVISLIAKR